MAEAASIGKGRTKTGVFGGSIAVTKRGTNRAFYGWVSILIIGIIIGLWGAINLLINGHAATGTNQQIPWGIWVPGYVFFVAASAGCVIVALGYALGIQKFALIIKRAIFLAIVSMLAGGILIILDLGSPQTAYNFLLSPNFQSPMWWMSFFYSLYLVLLLVEFFLISTGRVANLRTFSIFTALSAIAVHSTLGSIFGFASVRTYFGGALSPIYFILIAIIIGTSLLLLVTIFHYKLTKASMSSEVRNLILSLGKFLGVVVGIAIFFTIWKSLAGMLSTAETTSLGYQFILSSWWYWVFVIVIGLIIPFFLLLNPKTRTLNTVLFSAVMVLIGMFFARVEFTLGGQVMAIQQNLQHPGFSSSYFPSPVEFAVGLLAVSVAALLYTLGSRKLKLEKVASHD